MDYGSWSNLSDASFINLFLGDKRSIFILWVLVNPVISTDLIREKKATARPKDLGDLVELEKIQQELFPED